MDAAPTTHSSHLPGPFSQHGQVLGTEELPPLACVANCALSHGCAWGTGRNPDHRRLWTRVAQEERA